VVFATTMKMPRIANPAGILFSRNTMGIRPFLPLEGLLHFHGREPRTRHLGVCAFHAYDTNFIHRRGLWWYWSDSLGYFSNFYRYCLVLLQRNRHETRNKGNLQMIRNHRKIYGWWAQEWNTNSCYMSFFPQYFSLLSWPWALMINEHIIF
jgi:hypothetical protein